MAAREASLDGLHPSVAAWQPSVPRVLPEGDDGETAETVKGGAGEEIVELCGFLDRLQVVVTQAVRAELHLELADVLGTHVGEQGYRPLQRGEDDGDSCERGEGGYGWRFGADRLRIRNCEGRLEGGETRSHLGTDLRLRECIELCLE